MKLLTLCACLIGMLIFLPTAIAEILPWGDGTTSGSASAAASHGYYDDYEEDWGDNGYYTTETDTFQYHFEVLTDIETMLDLDGGWGRSVAIADADTDMVDSYIYYDIDYSAWLFDTGDPPVVKGSRNFDAYTGVYASWAVIASCEIEEGTWSNSFASAYAYASAGMQ